MDAAKTTRALSRDAVSPRVAFQKAPTSRGKEVDTTTFSSSSLSRVVGRLLLVEPESAFQSSNEILCDDEMHFIKDSRLFPVES